MIHKIDFKDLPKTHTPIFTYCRKLIKQGFDESDDLECYREDRLDFKVNIGKGSKLTVNEETKIGRPMFEKYRAPPRLRRAI